MYQKNSRGQSGRSFSHNRFSRGSSHGPSHFDKLKVNRFGGGRPQFARPRQNRNMGAYIDPAKFVNRNVVEEKAIPYTPKHRFEDFAIEQKLKSAIITKGYTTPTPIQDQSIPHVLQGKDIVGIANTGTGKTAAFLIPLIHKILLNPKEQVLIIVPTRELALQIEEELRGFTRGMGIHSVCCVGGAAIGPQLSALRFKNNFIIGTPGRLKDLIERGKIRLADFQTVVLDEADRMLDMGFIADMRAIMRAMHADRHTLFFSATLSTEIEGLINEFLNKPVRVSTRVGETAKNVEQDVVKIEKGRDKLDVLHNLLMGGEFKKVLVFGRTKHGVERLSKNLIARGVKAESIHGNKSHSQRQRALGKFKKNEVQVLVATDVAARGLDIADISHVINYDTPMSYDDYVHRIGRTGRGEKRGKALTFVE